MDKDCIFCRIVSGEQKSNVVFQDDLVIAFLDQFPISDGHTLVIPKEHYIDIHEISPEAMARVAVVAKKLADKYKKVLNCDGLNLVNNNSKMAGQGVFHYHMHVVPRYGSDKIRFNFHDFANANADLGSVYKKIMKS